jgi:hypothetical protein
VSGPASLLAEEKKEVTKKKIGGLCVVAMAAAMLAVIGGLSGCATMDRAYKQEVTWADAPVVHVFTNTLVVTNVVPVVLERTNIVFVTNAFNGGVSGYATREAIATNMVTAVVTNVVPVFMTNMVSVPVTNLVARPGAEATIQAAGSVINSFAPGVGSIVALALGGLYHGYRQVRNRKVNEALVQGVETARAVLATTPQGQVVDEQFVRWLMDHQQEAGVFSTVSELVDQYSDNPAAKLTAEEIAARVRQARQGGQVAAAA